MKEKIEEFVKEVEKFKKEVDRLSNARSGIFRRIDELRDALFNLRSRLDKDSYEYNLVENAIITLNGIERELEKIE